MKIQQNPVEERPYEKCEKYGPSSLNSAELLAIVLKTGTAQYNVKELAQQILTHYQKEASLRSLYQLSYEELIEIKGIGRVKALQIMALLEISKRIAKEKGQMNHQRVSPKMIADFFMEELRHERKEQFLAVFVDAKVKYIGHANISQGSLTATIVHPREVYRVAIQKSAHSIIVLHNHPSGDPAPSSEDLQITTRLKKAGEVIGIPLLDHIIIGDGIYTSLKEESYL